MTPHMSPTFLSSHLNPNLLGQPPMGRENGAGRREKLDDGGRGPTWLPTAGSARAVQLGLYCNGNAVFTYAGEGWGFCLVTLAKLLSLKLIVALGAVQKPMCSGVTELRLSSAEEHARFRRIVFEVNSICTTLWSHRPRHMHPSPRLSPLPSFLLAASLLPVPFSLHFCG